MSESVVTVCIPAYNCVEFIDETINALKRQKSKRWFAEISLDVSDDGSEQFIRRLIRNDNRFHLEVQKSRLGWVENINFLLSRVQTELYMIHPHDDYLSNDYIETVVRFLDDNPRIHSAVGTLKYTKNEKTLKIGGDKIGSRFERLRDYIQEPRNGLPFRAIARCGKNIRPPLLRNHTYEAKGNDLVWVMELLGQGNFAVLNSVFYWKRSRKGGLTGKWGRWPLEKRIASVAEYLKSMSDVLNELEVSDSERAELQAMLYYHLIRYISASPAYFARTRFVEAERINVASIIWASIIGGSPLDLDSISKLFRSDNLAAMGIEITSLESQLRAESETTEVELSAANPAPLTAGSLLAQADSELSAGNTDSALDIYLTIFRVAKNDAATLHKLSHRFQSVGMFDKAIETARIAKDLEPRSARRWVRLGALFLKSGQANQAKTCFKQAIHLEPKEASAHHHLSLYYSRDGQIKKALKASRAAYELRPDIEKYKRSLEKNKEHIGVNKLAHALTITFSHRE